MSRIRDSMSETLLQSWTIFSSTTMGRVLPVTSIEWDDEEHAGLLSYSVPDGGEPLHTLDGHVVRKLAFTYELDELEANDIN